MRQWTGSSLFQVMACRLFGAKPLPEPMLIYCQLDSREQVSVKFESEFYHFHSRKCIWKCRLPIWRPFCPGGDELKWHAFEIFADFDGNPYPGATELTIQLWMVLSKHNQTGMKMARYQQDPFHYIYRNNYWLNNHFIIFYEHDSLIAPDKLWFGVICSAWVNLPSGKTRTVLTHWHWDPVMHGCISKLDHWVIIGSGNGLSPV